jgi:hypothetical protein
MGLRSDTDEDVEWAVIFSGSARFADPLGQRNSGSDSDFLLGGGEMRVVGDFQVVTGITGVGPHAETDRTTDIWGEVQGEYVFRSGSYPTYSSKIVFVLPDYNVSGYPASDEVSAYTDRLVDPASNSSVAVFLGASVPDLFRVDYSSPALTDPSELGWDGSYLRVRAAITDLTKEANEASRAVLAGVLLGLAGSALLAFLLTVAGIWERPDQTGSPRPV